MPLSEIHLIIVSRKAKQARYIPRSLQSLLFTPTYEIS